MPTREPDRSARSRSVFHRQMCGVSRLGVRVSNSGWVHSGCRSAAARSAYRLSTSAAASRNRVVAIILPWTLSQRGRCRVIEDVDGGAGRGQAAEDLVVQLLVGGRQARLVDRDGDLGGDGANVVHALAQLHPRAADREQQDTYPALRPGERVAGVE